MASLEEAIQQKKFLSPYHKMVLNIIYTGGWITSLNNERLKKHKITPQQFNLLRILRGQYPNTATVNLLIERMLDKMSNASRLVDKLKIKRLVERTVSESDRRACDVVITKRGLNLLAKIDMEQLKWEDSFTALNKTEANELSRLLDKLRG